MMLMNGSDAAVLNDANKDGGYGSSDDLADGVDEKQVYSSKP